MALDATNKARMQASLGIGTDQTVFTDAELADIWTWASENFSQAMVYAIGQLLPNAAKMADYTAGQTSESRSQVFNNLMRLRDMWQEEAASTPQVAFAGLKSTPPRNRRNPSGYINHQILDVEEF